MDNIYWILIALGAVAIILAVVAFAIVIKNKKSKNNQKNTKNVNINFYKTDLDDIKKITKDFFKSTRMETVLNYFGNQFKFSFEFPKSILGNLKLELSEEKMVKYNERLEVLWNDAVNEIKINLDIIEEMFINKINLIQEDAEVTPMITKGYVSILNEILVIFKDLFVTEIFAMEIAILSKDDKLVPYPNEPINANSLKTKFKNYKLALKGLIKFIQEDLK